MALVSLHDDAVFRDYAKRCGAVALISRANVVTELPALIEELASRVRNARPCRVKRAARARQSRTRNTARLVAANT